MPARTQRRFANVLANSPAGARMRATQPGAAPAGQAPESSTDSGVTFTYYVTSSTTVGPIYGPNGNVWFSDGSTLGEFVPGTQQILEGTAVNGLAEELAADNDGNVWFGVGWGASVIGRSTSNLDITTYRTKGQTVDVVLGTDGNIYFSETAPVLGCATSSGTITEFPASHGTNDPINGPGNAIWFGENGPKVGRLTLGTSKVTEWTVQAGTGSGSLLATPDGSVWFGTDFVIGRITPAGAVEQYAVGGAGAFNLLYGPDGNVWFACQYAAQVGRVTPAGKVALYDVNDTPMGMAFGADGRLYVGMVSYYLAVVQLDGTVTERPLTGAIPYAPHLGPDGNIWFSGNPWQSVGVSPFVGRITPAGDLTEFAQSAYPNSFLNGTDGSTMYMGMNTYRFGVVTLG